VPSELELMAQFGCSRMTVNKAMSALAKEGLVVRRRRAGSFVARPRVHSTVLDIPDIQAQIGARGEAYRFDLLDRRTRKARAGDADERSPWRRAAICWRCAGCTWRAIGRSPLRTA
jgi:GntR family histidine utilization transcriptional repressor